MIEVKIEIYNDDIMAYEDYTAHAALPYKYAELLDEQLDEARLDLIGVKDKETFKPLSVVRVTVTAVSEAVMTESVMAQIQAEAETPNIAYSAQGNKLVERKEFFYFMSTDRSVEQPIGSGLYNHDIYLIELTKITERFISDSLTFRNSLGKFYAEEN